MAFRITYSVLEADLSQLHREFDQSLARVRAQLGRDHDSYILSAPFRSGEVLESRNPARPAEVLGRFSVVPEARAADIVRHAKSAAKRWGATPWQDRVKVLRRAAELISERRMEMAAIMTLEAGKNRMESLGDVEESADLIRYYAGQVEESDGFRKPLGKLSPNERTLSVLRPYGAFLVIAPFNFPLALSAGMAAGALLGGNSVILKPSQETPWCGELLLSVLRDAGLPEGVFQLAQGTGSKLGAALAAQPDLDGIVFTGSKEVGMRLYHSFSARYPKPCFLEMGGKNAAFVCESVSAGSDLDAAVEGCVRSAFGLSGQKCSALSRLFVHRSRSAEFLEKFATRARALVIGDPALEKVFMGPVINASAHRRHLQAVEEARRDGTVLVGGRDLSKEAGFEGGTFVEPVLARVKPDHRLWRDELFTPFLVVQEFDELEKALQQANQVEYGLTGGIFSKDPSELDLFFDQMEAGVLYSNRKTGATTGAWPGVNSFCGWKGSGSTGKGGCGPYYVSQFMREQSQTRME